MEIHTLPSSEEAAQNAAQAVEEILAEVLGRPVLFLVSGGSWFPVLDKIRPAVLGENVTVSMLDERNSRDPQVNNFAQLTGTDFYTSAEMRGVNFIDTRVGGHESQDELRERWARSLHSWWQKYNKEACLVATLGMGEDGHTAGIMPFPEDAEMFNYLFNGSRWVVSYDAGEKSEHSQRVTTTLTFLRSLSYGIVYAAGEEKREALERTVSEDGALAETPARIFQEVFSLQLFTNISLEN